MKENLGRSGFVLIGVWALWGSGTAEAQSCQSDDDCADGYVCETHQAGSCSGQACAPGEPCPEPVCEVYEYSACTPAPCSSDADCGDQMVCHTRTEVACSDRPTCAPGVECEEGGKESDCTESTYSQCTHRWELPCEVDSDCGEGFRCRENEYWVCDAGTDSSAGAMAPDAPDADGAAEPNCYPLPGPNSCELLELPCEDSADCSAGFECRPNPNAWGCGDSEGDGAWVPGDDGTVQEPSAGAAEDPGLPVDADGAASTPLPCEPPSDVPALVCMPSHWAGGDGSSGEEPPTDNGGDSHADGDLDGSGDGGVVPDDGAEPELPGEADGESAGHGRGKRLGRFLRALLGGGKGCSVSAAGGGPGDLSWLLGFGTLLGAARWRRRKAR